MDDCYACDRTAAPDAEPWEDVHRGGGWRLAHAFDTALPGWLVLLPTRHVTALHELTADEALAMGAVLRAASTALVEVTGCVKTYAALFAEAEGFGHLHVHLVPRHADQPAERRGPAVFGYLGVPVDQRVPEAERTRLRELLRATPALAALR